MKAWRRVSNIARYGLGPEARAKKKAAKQTVREARFADPERWQRAEDEVKRAYASYDEYLSHQTAKLEGISDRLEETEEQDFAEFTRRFASCAALQGVRSVLCLGARSGTEVRALHGLGHFAVGIDLNPGEKNAYVLPGDFHAIVFPDDSLDAIYTNALDHVFSLERVLGEVQRLLRPGGPFIADLVQGYEEGFIPGEFESVHWRDRQSFITRVAQLGRFEVEETRELGRHRRDLWTQVVFRKSS
jgi:SAM-dependent methyltransferase